EVGGVSHAFEKIGPINGVFAVRSTTLSCSRTDVSCRTENLRGAPGAVRQVPADPWRHGASRVGGFYERVRQTLTSRPPAKRKVIVSASVCLRCPRCRVVSNR